MLVEPEIEQDITISGDKLCVGCVGTLSLGTELFQAQDLFFCGCLVAEWGGQG